MRRFSLFLMIAVLATVSNACVASRKFVRSEVNTSSDRLSGALNARIDKTDGEVAEVRDGVTRADQRITAADQKTTAVDGRVSQLAAKTDQSFADVKNDVTAVDKKASIAQSDISALGEKFQNRNQYAVASEKAILFRFDSAHLDSKYETDLEEIASMLHQNPDALVVLVGRTDSTGDPDYNVKLGEDRVESVKRFLAIEKGIAVYRMHEISFGSAKPIAENTSREGRGKNRAVVVTVLVPKAPVTNN